MNQQLIASNEKLSETNRRLETLEKRMPRLPLLGGTQSSDFSLDAGPEAKN